MPPLKMCIVASAIPSPPRAKYFLCKWSSQLVLVCAAYSHSLTVPSLCVSGRFPVVPIFFPSILTSTGRKVLTLLPERLSIKTRERVRPRRPPWDPPRSPPPPRRRYVWFIDFCPQPHASASCPLIVFFLFQIKAPTSPSLAPTPSPTVFMPDSPSWANIGTDQVCEVEIPLSNLQRDRKLNVQAVGFSGSPESCFESCKEQLGVDGFEFNIYEQNGSPVCTCCLNCISKRAKPNAKIYQTCAEDISLRGTLSRSRTVRAGRTIVYKVQVKNPSKTTSWTDLLLTVNLPDGVTYLDSKLSYDKRAQKSTTSANKNVVTLTDLSLRAHQKRTFQVKVKVDADTSAATQLSFSATLSQTAFADAPYCARSTDASEVIITRGNSWGWDNEGGKIRVLLLLTSPYYTYKQTGYGRINYNAAS